MSQSSLLMQPEEPLNEDETTYAKGATFKQHKDKLEELAEVIDYKIDHENLEEIDFITTLKEEFDKDEKNQ